MNPTDEETIGEVQMLKEDLVEMDAAQQVIFMRRWFLDNFEDPANSMPYISSEGGYIWLDGGPYDAHEELHAKFGDCVAEGVIESLANELSDEVLDWAAQVDWADESSDRYSDYDGITQHFDEYDRAMATNREMLNLEVPEANRHAFYGMLFVNLITIIETYLSDAFISSVVNDERFMRRFIATTPEFKKRKITLSEVYDSVDKMSETALKYLEDFVWHRLAAVRNMYSETLDVTFPDQLGPIHRAIRVRHALVHRNGKFKGQSVKITKKEVNELADDVDGVIGAVADQVMLLDNENIFPYDNAPSDQKRTGQDRNNRRQGLCRSSLESLRLPESI